MAIISAGYDGTVDEVQFAGLVPKAGASEYGVDLAGDYAVTAVAGQDRTVSVAPGAAWGHSVIDRSDSNVTAALAAPVSGSRWDLIVLRRDWQPPGGATSVAVIQGGVSNVTLPARSMGAGVVDDQPLALVRVDAGSTTIGQIVDLRCWGRNGGTTARDVLALQYLGALGSMVEINGVVWLRKVTTGGSPTWVDLSKLNDTGWVAPALYSSYDGSLHVRRIGNRVQFRGLVRPSGGGNFGTNLLRDIGSIPAGFEPVQVVRMMGSGASSDADARLIIGSNRLLSVATGDKATSHIDFDAVTYLTD